MLLHSKWLARGGKKQWLNTLTTVVGPVSSIMVQTSGVQPFMN